MAARWVFRTTALHPVSCLAERVPVGLLHRPDDLSVANDDPVPHLLEQRLGGAAVACRVQHLASKRGHHPVFAARQKREQQ